MTTSRGSSMRGSGTSSTRTSCVPCQQSAFMWNPSGAGDDGKDERRRYGRGVCDCRRQSYPQPRSGVGAVIGLFDAFVIGTVRDALFPLRRFPRLLTSPIAQGLPGPLLGNVRSRVLFFGVHAETGASFVPFIALYE